MEELSLLAKDLLFEMVYHQNLEYDDIPEKYKSEYQEWKNKKYKENRE